MIPIPMLMGKPLLVEPISSDEFAGLVDLCIKTDQLRNGGFRIGSEGLGTFTIDISPGEIPNYRYTPGAIAQTWNSMSQGVKDALEVISETNEKLASLMSSISGGESEGDSGGSMFDGINSMLFWIVLLVVLLIILRFLK